MIIEIIFWITVLILGMTFLGYPIILYVFSLFIRDEQIHSVDSIPKVTLLISAFNESKVIERKIKNSLSLSYPDLEILVISDGSSDGTDAICAQYVPRIRLIHSDSNQGKNYAINQALPQIDSEIIVFSDANAFYKKDAIEHLVKHYILPKVGCVVGNLVLSQTEMSDVSRGEGLYWKYEHFLKILESKFGTLLVANGTIFSARKALLSQLETDVANDFQIPMKISSLGFQVRYEPEAVAYEKTATDSREEYNRKVRIVNRGIRGFIKLKKYLRGFRLFEFLFHKFFRWISGLLSVLLFLSSAILWQQPFYRIVLIVQIIFYALALVGSVAKSKMKLFYIPSYICLIHISASVAIVKAITGQTFSKWAPPQTSR